MSFRTHTPSKTNKDYGGDTLNYSVDTPYFLDTKRGTRVSSFFFSLFTIGGPGRCCTGLDEASADSLPLHARRFMTGLWGCSTFSPKNKSNSRGSSTEEIYVSHVPCMQFRTYPNINLFSLRIVLVKTVCGTVPQVGKAYVSSRRSVLG